MKHWISLYLHSGPQKFSLTIYPHNCWLTKRSEKFKLAHKLEGGKKKKKSREDFEKERHKNVPRSDTSVILNGFSWELLRFSSWWNSRKAGSKNRLEIIFVGEFIVSVFVFFSASSSDLCSAHSNTCTYSLEALRPLSVPHLHPPCGAVPLHWRCVLSRSDPVERAGLAGGRAGGKEGPHPWKLRGDAVAPKWKYLWTSYQLQPGEIFRDACASTLTITAKPCLSKSLNSPQASDDMLLLVDYSW